MMEVEFLPEAGRELDDATHWYEMDKSGLGAEFREEIQSTLERIVANPESFEFIDRNRHFLRIHRFPYGIIYRILPEKIRIIAVMHLHRKPGYWKGREIL